MKVKEVYTALDVASDIGEVIRSAKANSLVEYTRSTRVEPMVLLDTRAAQLPYIEDVLNNGLNIFAGYYLQAVSLAVDVGSVNVVRLLDRLNPNRDPIDTFANSFSRESFKHGLPFPGQSLSQEAVNANGKPIYNSKDYMKKLQKDADDKARKKYEDGKSSSDFSQGIKMVNEAANLSVGKLIDVSIQSGNQKSSIPVAIRLRVNTIRPDVMTHTLSLDSKDTSIKERWHQWRSGQIEFFKDLVMAQDLIDQHKKNMIKDESGYYRARQKQQRSNSISALLGGMSVATASSIFVMTKETAKELESKLRGRLSQFKTREKLFQETYAMMIFIVDPDWEQVTIYHRSIDSATEASIREIQRSNKSKNGPDIAEILNAFRQSKSPTI